jgi:SMODS and SLOG-associating 2TM effector domain 3/SMODS and SLOG-associating 2TM effector domain 1
MLSMNGVPEMALPGVHDAANAVSQSGQKRYVVLSAVRLWALLIAALAGAVSLAVRSVDFSGLVLLVAFVVAMVAELALIRLQPERDWYAGRAVAESTKTLAWRFGVQANPFGPALDATAAETLLRERMAQVLLRGRDRITIGPGEAIVTDSMMELRRSPFEERRRVYLFHRTENQRNWYSSNASRNERSATRWRFGLLFGEVIAVVMAALAFGREEPADFAGLTAAVVASGAAWISLRQYSQLTSAYRIAAGELALQASALQSVDERNWPQAVADAEEAISREHTMWLASRGEEPLS